MEEKKIVETLFVRRSVNVSEQDIDDILCTAFEGGITYWCDSVRVVGNYLGKYASDQISRGGKLKFHVEEPFDNEETEWYEMDQEKFLHGLQEWLLKNTVTINSKGQMAKVEGNVVRSQFMKRYGRSYL